MNNEFEESSLYLISNEYIPILIRKKIFIKPEKAYKCMNNFKIPTYFLDNFGKGCIKKTPNAFILFRNKSFNNVKLDNPNSSSREISKIIGKMWKEMAKDSKFFYQQQANYLKNRNSILKIKYNKFLSNLKRREYNTRAKKDDQFIKNCYLIISRNIEDHMINRDQVKNLS